MLDCNSLHAGDADVIETTLALIEPCLEDIKILANIGERRIGKLPDVGTLAGQSGINDLELWNGLLVKKGTPQEVKDRLAHFGEKTMMRERAMQLMRDTGARIYWQGAADAEARVAADRSKNDGFARINAN